MDRLETTSGEDMKKIEKEGWITIEPEKILFEKLSCSEESVDKAVSVLESRVREYVPYLFPFDSEMLFSELLSNFFRAKAEYDRAHTTEECSNDGLINERIHKICSLSKDGECQKCVSVKATIRSGDNHTIVILSTPIIPHENSLNRISERLNAKHWTEFIEDNFFSVTGGAGCGIWIIRQVLESMDGKIEYALNQNRFVVLLFFPRLNMVRKTLEYVEHPYVFPLKRRRMALGITFDVRPVLTYLSENTPLEGDYYKIKIHAKDREKKDILHCFNKISENFPYKFLFVDEVRDSADWDFTVFPYGKA